MDRPRRVGAHSAADQLMRDDRLGPAFLQSETALVMGRSCRWFSGIFLPQLEVLLPHLFN
jgi:hypothetical protein